MFKKIHNMLTAPVRLLIVAAMMIHAALILAFNDEEARQYDYDMGCGEIDK
jgi:hypothetical protein